MTDRVPAVLCRTAATLVCLQRRKRNRDDAQAKRPSVIWLISRSAPAAAILVARRTSDAGQTDPDVISLDYHETLFAAAALRPRRRRTAEGEQGKYILRFEGPFRSGQRIYCQIGGRRVDS